MARGLTQREGIGAAGDGGVSRGAERSGGVLRRYGEIRVDQAREM